MIYKSAREIKPGVLIMDDDSDVRLLLTQQQRTEFLQMHKEQQRLFCIWTDPVIRILFVVCHYQNFPDAKDNGLVCWGIDLDTFTPEQAGEIASKIQQGGSAGCSLPLHFVAMSPKGN